MSGPHRTGIRVGIDSYCFARQFGEIFPHLQRDPGYRMSVWDFLDFAEELAVEGVSIETAFLPDEYQVHQRICDRLAGSGIEKVWAWGHPRGLHSGRDEAALVNLRATIRMACDTDTPVLRIVAGDRHTRMPDWREHKAALTRQLEIAVRDAAECGVVLAIENHKDLLAQELVELVSDFDSPFLGVCLDTGNNLRLFEDPLMVARVLAPWAKVVHAKDITVQRGNPQETRFWPTVPLGHGLVDIPAILGILAGAGFCGVLAVETDYLHPDSPDEHESVRQSVRYLRTVLADRSSPGSQQADGDG